MYFCIYNYRTISISPTLSIIFQRCILNRYSKFPISSPNQFGFKKGSSCSHAIYSVRQVVEHYVNGGSTVNVCFSDLSKACDKMNHYSKLMNRSIPIQVLSVFESWFSLCLSCVKWGSVMSYFYELKTGVRQGGVLSGELKTRDWKTRDREKYGGGKRRTGKRGTKSQGWKRQDWKTRDQIAGVEKAGLENAGPNF